MKHPDLELNLGNISRMVPIDILVKPGIIENIHIGASCTDDEIQTYKALFQEFRDVFAWSYEEMPGIDPLIVFHETKLTQMLNLSINGCVRYIHEKLLLLKLKWRN